MAGLQKALLCFKGFIDDHEVEEDGNDCWKEIKMKRTSHRWLLLISLSSALATKDGDLPLCPTNIQYFPQNLPMHCRMPRNSEIRTYPEMQQYPTLPPLPQSFYQSLPPNKQPNPVPIPIPPFPGMPGPMGPMGGLMGGMPPMPGAMPMPMPMVGGPPHKLPVIVMPFYSPDHSFKKPPSSHRRPINKSPRKKKKPSYDSDTKACSDETSSGSDTSDNSGSSDEHVFWKGRRKLRKKMTRRFLKRQKMRQKERKNQNKDLLTPILQYVTKDGYVIFEKKISKGEAKDWLRPKNEVNVVDESKNDDKDKDLTGKSNEEYPKTDVEELPMRDDDKSKETIKVEHPTQKVRVKIHRPRKVNNFGNIPGSNT